MIRTSIARYGLIPILSVWGLVVVADPVEIAATDAQNGLTDIYSATFDGPPIIGGDPFFGITPPPPPRAVQIQPNPTGVLANTVPGGFAVPPAAGSFLDLTLSAGNTMVTLAGGTIAFPTLTLVINEGQASETIVNAAGSGIVFEPTPVMVPVDGNGVAIFEVDLTGIGIAADFSTFADIVGPMDCTGALCPVIPLLTLDMLLYRLTIDYDATFSSFTGTFRGQTANASTIFATLNSVVPDIAVTDSVAPAGDLLVPYGSVTEMTSADRTVTVTNAGAGNLVLGTIAQADPLAAPFSIVGDTCSAQTLTALATCTITLRFAPASTGAFSDSFDIPSNDVDETSVIVNLTGTGTAMAIPDIGVTDSVAPNDDSQIPFGSVSQGMMADETVTVTNNGNAPLTLGQVAMANPLMAPFSVVNDTCSTQVLAPAASCTFDVRFEPTAVGNFLDSLDIPSDDPDEPSITVDVTGTGTAVAVADIAVTDSIAPNDDLDVDFGDVTEQFTAEETVTVTNSGTADLTIGQVAQANALADPFGVENDGCSGRVLMPMASCNVVIRFNPTSLDMSMDSFDIPSDDPDEPSVAVAVSGMGAEPTTSDVVVSSPSGSDSGFFGLSLDLQTLLVLGAFVALYRVNQARRRRRVEVRMDRHR